MPLNPLKFLRKVNWRVVLAGLFAIGALHIIAVFTEPYVSGSDAYDRLKGKLPLNKMIVLPPVSDENQPLPFMAPDARYAMCRYTTENGPVAVNAVLRGPGWLLTAFDDTGISLNTTVAATDRLQTVVALRLMPSDDRFMGLSPQSRGLSTKETTALPVGAQRGMIVVRAPDQGSAFAELQEAALLQASCHQLRPDKEQ